MNENIPDGDTSEEYPQGRAAVLAAIKAIHATGGHLLTRAETIEFITQRFYLGPPERLHRKYKRTQYDRADERRAKLRHALVRNPANAIKGGAARHQAAQAMRALVLEFQAKLPARTPKHKQVSAVIKDMARAGHNPSQSIVQRILRAAR